MIRQDGNYWCDGSNNKWDIMSYTREDAKLLSDTMKDSRDCVNSSHCVDCVDCTNCISCEECEGCFDCKGCYQCKDCIDCTQCYECEDSKNCSYTGNQNNTVVDADKAISSYL